MDYYIEAMKKQSIPLELAGKTDINGSSVLKSFLALYRFLLQPYDAKSIQGAKQIVYHGSVVEGDEVAKKRLEQLYQSAKHLNIYGKAQFLLERIEYLLNWNEAISKEEMYALQARLHQMVESVFAVSKESPEQILQAFETFIENKLEHELMLVNQDAVRFMNLHKSKGLEGNITILANRKEIKEHIPEYTASDVNANGQYDYYGSFSDSDSYFKAHGYFYDADTKAVMQTSIAEDEAEKIRLEYVAVTRAKEVLIVTKAFSEKAPYTRYQIAEEQNFKNVILPQEEGSQDVQGQPIMTGIESVYALPTEEMKEAVYVSLSPSSLEGIIMDVDSEGETEPEWKRLNPEERERFPRRPKGNIFGTTMHRSFELFIQQRKDPDFDILACVCQAIIENADELLLEGKRWYLKEGEQQESYLTAVREFLLQALQKLQNDARLCTLLEEAKEVYTELPFSYYTSKQENPELFGAIQKHLDNHEIQIGDRQPVWVNGTADLVIVGVDQRIHVIDFKSDSKYVDEMEVFEKELALKYEGQLLLYKYSMSQIFKVDLENISTELFHLY